MKALKATKSAISSAALPASFFNARGVVPVPSFSVARPLPKSGGIEFTVCAHQVEGGLWIAQPRWVWREGSIPLDATPLHSQSRRFRTRSEAVDDAMSRGLRMVRAQAHRKAKTKAWAAAIEHLRSWMADAMAEVRKHDETLPLRGLVGIDLFAGGLGGLSMGMVSLGMQIDLACEIDPKARSVYERNVRPRKMHDDICTLDGRKLKADIITMGLLCQAFSKAGKGLGFADPKLAATYEHAMRVLEEADAKAIVIECSRRFLTLDAGKHADVLIERLLAVGYRVQHRALNASGFGVAQDRERSFLVCTRIGLPVDPVLGYLFPEEQKPTACVADILDDEPATILEADIVSHRVAPTGRVPTLAQVGRIGRRNSQGYRVYDPCGIGPTLTASGGGRARFSGAFRVPGGARPLTPREACRMQGLPDWAEHHSTRTPAMRHAGNAVAVPLARELMRQLGGILGQS